MKRRLVLAVGLMLVAVAFSACDNKKAGPESSKPTDFTPPPRRASAATEPLVDLPALANKSKNEVDAILGKPTGSGDEGPYHNRIYPVKGLSGDLFIQFHNDKAEILEAAFVDKPSTRKEALARIGIDDSAASDHPDGHSTIQLCLRYGPFSVLNLRRDFHRGRDLGGFPSFYVATAPSRYK